MASQGALGTGDGGVGAGKSVGSLHHPRQKDATAWSSAFLSPSCCTWRSPGGWGGLGACVSGPYLFSPSLILVPPAAPHTTPQSLNPQGVGKGGQLYSAARIRASYPCSPAGLSQQSWPQCPQPCPGHCLRSAPRKSASLLFLSKPGPVPSTFWFLGGGHTLPGAIGD